MITKSPTEPEEILSELKELTSLKKINSELSQASFDFITEQSKIQSLLHNASDGIIVFAADGTVENFNIAAQHIFGYSEAEVVRRKIPDLIPCPDSADENVAAYIHQFISSRTSPDIPLLGKHKMGFDISLQVSTGQASLENILLFDDPDLSTSIPEDVEQSNRLKSQLNDVIICFFRDVSEDKRLEKELKDLKYALDLAAGVIRLDKEFRLIDVNDNLCQMLGRQRDEFIGEQCIHSKFTGLPLKMLKLQQKRDILSHGKIWVGETCLLDKNNEKIWFTENITPFLDKDNIPYQYLCILINVTDRKQFETQLEQHRDSLQDLVDAQVSDIEHAKNRAENANRSKTDFLANMSHELRTPMHSIVSFTQLGLKQFETLPLDESSTEKLQKFLSNIKISSHRLLSLLNDLLDLSKLESGKEEFNLEKCNIFQLTEQIRDEFSAKFEEKAIDFVIITPDQPRSIYCDKSKILQVICNLTSNAIKFSPSHSTIVINIETTSIVLGRRATDKEKTKGVLFSMTDQGSGIPKDELDTVFDKFIQSSKTKSSAGGTGLGLSICKEIISAHKGKIWAESNPEGGAIFKLFLPDVDKEIV